ncbi:MAG: hypothetical protein ACR2JC_01620 [Chloroflexota bacterium]
MIRPGAVAVLAVAMAGIKIDFVPFDSTLYPYRVQQPMAYRHIVFPDSAGHQVDYFAPSLGSFVTNVNIYATGDHPADEAASMRATGAHHVHVSGSVVLLGKRVRLLCGDWSGLVGKWREERLQFEAQGLTWHLTISYDRRFSSSRSLMLRMLRSFQLR